MEVKEEDKDDVDALVIDIMPLPVVVAYCSHGRIIFF